MILRDNEIELVPGVDLDYLVGIVQKYKFNMLSEYGIRKVAKNISHFWTGKAYGYPMGVLFLHFDKVTGRWFFDAYKDDEELKRLDNRGNFSYRAGKLVLDWFFDNRFSSVLYTAHDRLNRGATLACLRLGFKIEARQSDFVVLKVGRS